MPDPTRQCAELIKKAKCAAALTGAGISTAAGIPDFRGPEGLYVTRRYDPDKVFDIGYFHRDPKPFFEFARDFLGLEEKLEPTFTHRFLAKLEEQGNLKGVVTQNIDSLHQMAGSKNVMEMHGSFWNSACLNCAREFSFEELKKKLSDEEIPHCPCGGIVKPGVVFFGEDVKYLAEAGGLAAGADLFFVIGTSCAVYPAAMIPQYTSGKIVVVNKGDVKLEFGNVVLEVQEDLDHFFQEVANHLNPVKGGTLP